MERWDLATFGRVELTSSWNEPWVAGAQPDVGRHRPSPSPAGLNGVGLLAAGIGRTDGGQLGTFAYAFSHIGRQDAARGMRHVGFGGPKPGRRGGPHFSPSGVAGRAFTSVGETP